MDKPASSRPTLPPARLRFFAPLLAGALLFGFGGRAAQAVPAERTLFSNSFKAVPKAQKQATLTDQKAAASDVTQFQIALRMRDFAKLQDRVSRGERVSEQEMREKYLPLASDYQAVADWVHSQGLSVLDKDPARLSVRVGGPVAIAERALATRYEHVTVAGKDRLAAQSTPSLPSHLAASVLSINGLQPHQRMSAHSPTLPGVAPYSISDILTTYLAQNLPNPLPVNASDTALSGKGQTIAILTNTFPFDQDPQTFWSDNKINHTGTISNIQVDDADELPDPSGEETLDVSWAGGVAPGADLRVYAVGGTSTDGSMNFDNVTKGLQRILSDLRSGTSITQVSISAGVSEEEISQGQAETQSQYFASFAAAGVSVFVSTGDSSIAEYPSTDPSVTAVGGTSLLINTNNSTFASETSWASGGGGQSSFFQIPAYQNIVNQQAAVGQRIQRRAVPDVSLAAVATTAGSAVAGEQGAYLILSKKDDSGNIVEQPPTSRTGTSWSTAVWAGFGALINQSRAAYDLPPVGLLNPSVYPLLGTRNLRDIIQDPGLSPRESRRAVSGYDTSTGVGVPLMSRLVPTLSNAGTFSVTAFSPESGVPGSQVTLSGTQLDLTSAVIFNGTTAPIFQAASGTQLVVTVPGGATTGPITLISRTGATATTSAPFTVLPVNAGRNDLFANAELIGPAQTRLVGTNVGATKEFGEPDHAGNPGGASVWYRWNPPVDGTYTFNTFGSSFDTLLAVYTGPDIFSLTEVASSDDLSNSVASSVVFEATFGTTYYIAVDGVLQSNGVAAQGTVVLNVASANDEPVVNDFVPPSGSPSQSIRVLGANFLGVTDVRFNGVPATFRVDSGTQITAVVPTGATTGPITLTDAQNNTAESTNFFTVIPNPGNDLFANAIPITGLQATLTGTNGGATKEPGEPNHAGNPGGSSVWFTWTAPRTGAFSFDTFSSDFDTLLAVYTGTNVAALTQIAANDDAGPLGTSSVTFNATAGTAYRIAVDGYNNAAGTYVLNLRSSTGLPVVATLTPTSGGPGVNVVLSGSGFLTATSVRFNGTVAPNFLVNSDNQITVTVPEGATTGPVSVTGLNGTGSSATAFTVIARPINDNFGDATTLVGGAPIFGNGSNAGATKQPGEPNIIPEDAGGRSIWYAWTPPLSGNYTISTQGSDFDTLLGVYTGTVVTNLQLVAANDDDEQGGVTSSVTFTATRDVTYHIAVDGTRGEAGNVSVSINGAATSLNLYTTNFEASEGFDSKRPLIGQGGWVSAVGVTGGNGIGVNQIPNLGQQGLVGQTPLSAGATTQRLYRPFAYTFDGNFPVVNFSTVLRIAGSTNGQNDQFAFTATNRAGGTDPIDYFSLVFDNATSAVYYRVGTNSALQPTGVSFSRDVVYSLQMAINFDRSSVSATLNGNPVLVDLRFNAVDRLTGITADWTPTNPAAPGDNYMVFDQYAVSAPSAAAPTILTQPSDVTVLVGQPATFSVQATGTPVLEYQWFFAGQPILNGLANGPTFTVENAGPTSAGRYSVVVTNVYGTVQSLDAFLVVSTSQVPANTTITVQAQARSITSAPGQKGVFILTRTGDLTQALAVDYKTFSTAQAGVDYLPLRGRTTFKAGQAQRKLRIFPIDRDIHDGSRVKVAFKILSGNGYKIGDGGKAKLFIVRE